MDLTDLETFVLSVRSGSLSGAARRLFVSQPAVTARIQRLEAELGETLLRRTGRGVQPTAAGSHLLARAQPVLQQLRELDRELSPTGPLRGRLAFGATDLVAVHHLPSILASLRAEQLHLEISVRVEGTAPLLGLIESGEIEAAIGTLPVRGPYETTPIFRDRLVVVAPPAHPLSRRRRVSTKGLAGEAWILHKSDSITRQLVEGFLTGVGVAPRVEMEISSPEAIRELVQAGLGLAVLPECSVQREISDGRLARLPVSGFRLERVSGWIQRRDDRLSRAVSALAAHLGVDRADQTD